MALLILVNLGIFWDAYPVMTQGSLPSKSHSLDFGSYYIAAWRLIHNPSQLYTRGTVAGDYSLGKNQTVFKYLPYFPFVIVPFLAFDYVTALVSWNIFQFLLLPIIGVMLYRSLKEMNILVVLAAMCIVIVQPLPILDPSLSYVSHSLTGCYNAQWKEGQAKVFLTFLIVASYYFSKERKPRIAGFLYGLAFFDPRFGLYSIPLFLMVNRNQYRRFSLATLGTLLVGNSLLLYDGLGGAFLNMVKTAGLSTPLFSYAYIPLYAIVALTAIESAVFLHARLLKRSDGTLGPATVHSSTVAFPPGGQ